MWARVKVSVNSHLSLIFKCNKHRKSIKCPSAAKLQQEQSQSQFAIKMNVKLMSEDPKEFHEYNWHCVFAMATPLQTSFQCRPSDVVHSSIHSQPSVVINGSTQTNGRTTAWAPVEASDPRSYLFGYFRTRTAGRWSVGHELILWFLHVRARFELAWSSRTWTDVTGQRTTWCETDAEWYPQVRSR
jgi:hypothetical protein